MPVTLEANDSRCQTWALLDQGSEITVIRADLARRLHLIGSVVSIKIDTVNGEQSQDLIKLPQVVACSRDQRTKIPLLEAFAMENLRIDAKMRDADSLVSKWPHLADIDLQSPEPNTNRRHHWGPSASGARNSRVQKRPTQP